MQLLRLIVGRRQIGDRDSPAILAQCLNLLTDEIVVDSISTWLHDHHIIDSEDFVPLIDGNLF